MQRMINESEAKQIALEYVKSRKSGAQTQINSVERQDLWVMETQTKEAKGDQCANVTVSGTGEVKDYKMTTFTTRVSMPEKIKSKLRSVFSRSK